MSSAFCHPPGCCVEQTIPNQCPDADQWNLVQPSFTDNFPGPELDSPPWRTNFGREPIIEPAGTMLLEANAPGATNGSVTTSYMLSSLSTVPRRYRWRWVNVELRDPNDNVLNDPTINTSRTRFMLSPRLQPSGNARIMGGLDVGVQTDLASVFYLVPSADGLPPVIDPMRMILAPEDTAPVDIPSGSTIDFIYEFPVEGDSLIRRAKWVVNDQVIHQRDLDGHTYDPQGWQGKPWRQHGCLYETIIEAWANVPVGQAKIEFLRGFPVIQTTMHSSVFFEELA